MYGTDYNYAESRLADSIVRLRKTGDPVLVQHIDAVDGSTQVMVLKNKSTIHVPLDDLNPKPVPLGWCNTRDGASYLARIPKRRDWRQGLRAETCFSSRNIFRRIPYADIAKCICGEYPKFQEVLAAKEGKVVAWSRKWATDCVNVYFGNLGTVGRIENGVPVLTEGFLFLKESLEKSLS